MSASEDAAACSGAGKLGELRGGSVCGAGIFQEYLQIDDRKRGLGVI